MLRNRRIGCSMSGLAQFLARHGRPQQSLTNVAGAAGAALTSTTIVNAESSSEIQSPSSALISSASVALESNSSSGLHELQRWSEAGYHAIQEYDKAYSEWFAIPRSIKTTSIKPSGTVSLLAGATPGLTIQPILS
jgi:hypothetical protein